MSPILPETAEMPSYLAFLPAAYYYLAHLLLWGGSVFLVQWLVGLRILRANWRVIVPVSLLMGTYLVLTDVVAVWAGVWFFDERLILGFNPLGVPIEEWVFFYLTSFLVVQSFILFLPEKYRLPPSPKSAFGEG